MPKSKRKHEKANLPLQTEPDLRVAAQAVVRAWKTGDLKDDVDSAVADLEVALDGRTTCNLIVAAEPGLPLGEREKAVVRQALRFVLQPDPRADFLHFLHSDARSNEPLLEEMGDEHVLEIAADVLNG